MVIDSRRYESDPQQDVPVTTATQAGVRVVYARARSYRNRMAGQPAQNYLAWRAGPRKVVFAICDGHDSPFAGQLAARFLGERLMEWLWALPDDLDTPQDELKVRLAYQLNAWAQPAQERVLSYPLPEGLSDAERENLENLRRSQGSETLFACGRVDYTPAGEPQVLFAWAGETYLRCIAADGGPLQFDPVRNPANRWSSVIGLRGSLSVARLGMGFDARRILAYSAPLGNLEPDLAGYSPRRLQGLMQECFLNRTAGDLAYLDLSLLPQAAEENETPEDTTDFRSETGTILLKYQLTRDQIGFFEWSFPTGAIYAVVEERTQAGSQRTLYAGPSTHWVVQDGAPGSLYRVCVYSPDGVASSDWVAPVMVEEAPVAENAPQAPPDGADQAQAEESQAGETPAADQVFEAPDLFDKLFSDEPRATVPDDLPLWTSETSQPEPPEAETRATQALDWEHWQPKYYEEPTAPAAPTQPVVGPGAETQPVALAAPEEMPASSLGIEPLPLAVEPEIEPEPELEAPPLQAVPEETLPAVEETAPLQPGSSPPQPGGTGWMNFRSGKGDQPGEYTLEWNPISQVRDYEIKAHFGSKDRLHTVSGSRDTLKGLEPGRHYFRIRPIYPGPRPEWDENNLAVIDVPDKIQKAPGNLSLEINPDHTFSLRWVFPAGEVVEEFWVYDVTGKKPELLLRLPPETSRCQITPPGLEERRRYSVRAVNWTGPGPESRPVIYNPPGAQPPASPLRQLLGLFRSPPPASSAAASVEKVEKEESVTCSTFYELCEEVTRYLKRHGIRMERIRLEQRVGSEDNYIPVDSRRTTELVSLNFTKGPDHRLYVFGSKGELVTAVITFDKIRWTMKVKFTLSQKP